MIVVCILQYIVMSQLDVDQQLAQLPSVLLLVEALYQFMLLGIYLSAFEL